MSRLFTFTFLAALLVLFGCKKEDDPLMVEPQTTVPPDAIESYHITLNAQFERVAMEYTKGNQVEKYWYTKDGNNVYTWKIESNGDTTKTVREHMADGEHLQSKDTLSCDSNGCILEEQWAHYKNNRLQNTINGRYLYKPNGEREKAGPETVSTYTYSNDQLIKVSHSTDGTDPISTTYTYSTLTAKYNTNSLFGGTGEYLVKTSSYDGGGSRYSTNRSYSYQLNSQSLVTQMTDTRIHVGTGIRNIVQYNISYTFE
ncbi:hypothetical protein KFE98_09375 [bacterium SCSIO 12741]|nr:hypothetical protein KFE98_09375 [bacterium SCSIO 12741]